MDDNLSWSVTPWVSNSVMLGENGSEITVGNTPAQQSFQNEHWTHFDPVSRGVNIGIAIFMIPVTFMAIAGNGAIIWLYKK